MFSVKQNILETVALFKAHGIRHIVLSPGSRNAPLIETFSNEPFFECQICVDERNAAFYALGIILETQQPVAVCCTSGTAVLNYGPAIAEAYYQELPLIVLSADRTQEWIGQMDGQTIPQASCFGAMVKKSVQLPEIKDENDKWYCNRLINEALIACKGHTSGPVHLNLPIAEPLFDYSVEKLPEVRKINIPTIKNGIDTEYYCKEWAKFKKRIIIVGQMQPGHGLEKVLQQLSDKCDCIILAEQLSNVSPEVCIGNFDTVLSSKIFHERKEMLRPELIVTIGGHIVSKKIKQFLRQNQPQRHWHIKDSSLLADTFQCLTDFIECDEKAFLLQLAETVTEEKGKNYRSEWKQISDRLPLPPIDKLPFSDLTVVGRFMERVPKGAAIHLANSSAVRLAQLFPLGNSNTAYCNRGTNGIESSLPTFLGFKSVCQNLCFLIIGDLSFFYGLNALWNLDKRAEGIRILLLNNSGGSIFYLLRGLEKAVSLKEYVAASHTTSAAKWVEAAGLTYLSATNDEELYKALEQFCDPTTTDSIIMEVFTDPEVESASIKQYYKEIINN